MQSERRQACPRCGAEKETHPRTRALNPPPLSPFPIPPQNLMKLGHNRRAETTPLDKDRKPVR